MKFLSLFPLLLLENSVKNHDILLSIIKRQTHDAILMILLQEIINSFSPGLPLGNLTSQLFANIYMNELDQFIKHRLKIIGYIRYTDDIILINSNRELLLNYLGEIIYFLREKLCLNVHPKKVILKTYSSGVDYLGYVCFPHFRVLRTKTKQRMFKRINKKN